VRVLRGRGQGLLHESELEFPVLAQDIGLGFWTGRDLLQSELLSLAFFLRVELAWIASIASTPSTGF